MASYESAFELQITDVNGDSALMRVTTFLPDTLTVAQVVTALGNLVTAVTPCTNGKITMQGFRFTTDRAQISAGTAPPPASAVYPSVTDGARLSFANSAGGKRVVVIPAPLLTDFVTGTNTVNPADTNISALISVIESETDLTGATNLYEGGVKVGRHARRRPARKHL